MLQFKVLSLAICMGLISSVRAQQMLPIDTILVDTVGKVYNVNCDYESGIYSENISFRNAKFNEKIAFRGILFNGKVSFTKCHFRNGLDLSESWFDKTLDLSGTTFDKKIRLNWVKLAGKLILRDVKFNQPYGVVDLTSIEPKAKTNLDNLIEKALQTKEIVEPDFPILIDLQNTNINKLKLDYTNFKLYFGRSDSTGVPTDTMKRRVYEEVLRLQEKYGFENGRKKLLRDSRAAGFYMQSVVKDETQPKTSKGPGIGVALILMGLIAFIILFTTYHFKKTMGTSTQEHGDKPPIPHTSVQVVFKNTISLVEIEKNVQESVSLWKMYDARLDDFENVTDFWRQYEQLLKKAKHTKSLEK